jgi:hypothetical protein
MTKTALQAAKTKAAFQWDPDNDQTFNGTTIPPLQGPASSFDKVRGKSFTMDAPGQTLTLQVTPSDAFTTWGRGNGTAPAVIDVKNGTLIYDANTNKSARTRLILGDFFSPLLELTLTVENDARFAVMADSSNGGGGALIQSNFGLGIGVTGSGIVDIACDLFSVEPTNGAQANIAVAQEAQMSTVTSGNFVVGNAAIDISSSPATGSSLNWVCNWPDATAMQLHQTSMGFSAKSNGLLRSPGLAVDGTRVTTRDTAVCSLQFDSFASRGDSHFILGPGTAKMQFDPYTAGKYPFDFVNNTYPQGLFDITSAGSVNKGTFVIKVASGFDAAAIVTRGYVAIDGVVQGTNHLNYEYKNGYAIVYQTSLAV